MKQTIQLKPKAEPQNNKPENNIPAAGMNPKDVDLINCLKKHKVSPAPQLIQEILKKL